MRITDASRDCIERFNEANMTGDADLIGRNADCALSIIVAKQTSQAVTGSRSRFLLPIGFALAALGVFGPIVLGRLIPDRTATPSAPSDVAGQYGTVPARLMTFADRFDEAVSELPPTIGVSAVSSHNPLAARLAEYPALLQDRARETLAAEGTRQPRSETTGAHP